MNCPICHNLAYRIFPKNGYWIYECGNCNHRFTEVNPSSEHINKVYGDEYFKGMMEEGYPDYHIEAELLIEHGKYYSMLLRNFTKPDTILDVGCAAGYILKGYIETGWQGIGLEPNFKMASYGRDKLGLQIENGTLEEFSSSQRFDLVSMVQVISHFYDLRKALKKAADITKPGGFWLIETWDRESWVARCLGKNWHEYSPPSVLHWFSPQGLKNLASLYGFSEVVRGHPSKRISGARAKSLIKSRIKRNLLRWVLYPLKIIPDETSIPYPGFDLFWALYKKGFNSDVNNFDQNT